MTSKADPTSEVVYYIRRGGLIKIGYTSRFVNRMRVLEPDEVLAVEPGNLRLESGRRQQFEAFRVTRSEGREWFAPEPALLAHIALMASIYETPPLPLMPARRVRRDRVAFLPDPLDGWGGIPGKLLA